MENQRYLLALIFLSNVSKQKCDIDRDQFTTVKKKLSPNLNVVGDDDIMGCWGNARYPVKRSHGRRLPRSKKVFSRRYEIGRIQKH